MQQAIGKGQVFSKLARLGGRAFVIVGYGLDLQEFLESEDKLESAVEIAVRDAAAAAGFTMGVKLCPGAWKAVCTPVGAVTGYLGGDLLGQALY